MVHIDDLHECSLKTYECTSFGSVRAKPTQISYSDFIWKRHKTFVCRFHMKSELPFAVIKNPTLTRGMCKKSLSQVHGWVSPLETLQTTLMVYRSARQFHMVSIHIDMFSIHRIRVICLDHSIMMCWKIFNLDWIDKHWQVISQKGAIIKAYMHIELPSKPLYDPNTLNKFTA